MHTFIWNQWFKRQKTYKNKYAHIFPTNPQQQASHLSELQHKERKEERPLMSLQLSVNAKPCLPLLFIE